MTSSTPASPVLSDSACELRAEVVEGLLYTHGRLSFNTGKALETASFLYALIELLNEKGLLTIDELDARKQIVAERLAEQFRQNGTGVLLQDPEYDKYTFQGEAAIDCASRIHLCQAACCRLPFALSKQDVREGIVHWELGRPYLIAHDDDGYCHHLERGACRCTVREHRPVPCRAYDCRNEKRIWLDFDAMVVNPDTHRQDWPHEEKASPP